MTDKPEHLILPNSELATLLKEVCSKGHSFKFTATGDSMSPFICDGDTIIVYPYSKNRPVEVGDIVAYADPEKNNLIVHRLIKKKGEQYLMKGDNVYQIDGCFMEKNFHGYVKKVRFLGKKLPFFQDSMRNFFQVLNKFKFFLAFLSYWKILTPFCRIQNKLLR